MDFESEIFLALSSSQTPLHLAQAMYISRGKSQVLFLQYEDDILQLLCSDCSRCDQGYLVKIINGIKYLQKWGIENLRDSNI